MGGLTSLSSIRGMSAPLTGLVTVQTLLVLAVQTCSAGTFAWIRQLSPTAGNVDTVQVPGPDSKSSKKRRSLVPAFTVTLSTDQPSAGDEIPSAADPPMSLVKMNRNWTGLYFAMSVSGILIVNVSNGPAPCPWTDPVHVRKGTQEASMSRTSSVPKSKLSSDSSCCLKAILTGLAAPLRFTKFFSTWVQLLSYPRRFASLTQLESIRPHQNECALSAETLAWAQGARGNARSLVGGASLVGLD